jgi:IclR family mhp operon transcriptional activator
MEKGVPIRSVSRSLAVLQAINQAGSLTLMDIAQSSKVPYPTACRIVQTLEYEGLIEREPVRKRYRPTALVRSLSQGFQEHSALTDCARPHMVALTRKLLWPVLLSTRVGAVMMVRESTHAHTSRCFNSLPPGFVFPVMESASGRVCLAFMEDEARETLLRSLAFPQDIGENASDATGVLDAMFSRIRKDGFATSTRNSFTPTPNKTSSIAAPIMVGGAVAGVLTLEFFSSAMETGEAVQHFARDLMAVAKTVGEEAGRGAA